MEYLRFVTSNTHLLSAHPALSFQQAANQPDLSGPSQAAYALYAAGQEKRHWFKVRTCVSLCAVWLWLWLWLYLMFCLAPAHPFRSTSTSRSATTRA